MAYSFRHTEPKLVGVVVKEKVRCGKKNCRCVKGSKYRHRWYYYLYWRDRNNGGILKKEYVSKKAVRKLKRKITMTKNQDKEEKLRFKNFMKLFNQLTFQEKEELFNEPLNS